MIHNNNAYCFTIQTAVIKESLRMAPTTTSENSRLVPAKGAKIGEDFIPGNVSSP